MSQVTTNPIHLNDSISVLDGIGPAFVERLANLNIVSIQDLLHHFPRAYDDRSQIRPIASIEEGSTETVTVSGTVISSRLVHLRGRSNLAVVEIEDDTGKIQASWFGRGFLVNSFQSGKRVLLTGDVGSYKGLCLKNPEYEFLTGDADDQLNTGRIVPIYRLTDKISQRVLRKWIATALDRVSETIPDQLPEALRKQYNYPPANDAIRQAHFPETMDTAQAARDRFVYEELFELQLKILKSRRDSIDSARGIQHTIDGPHLGAFRDAIPFELTQGQVNAVDDLLNDMAGNRPMRRLIQGDVGCGKTLVACHAMAAAVDGGYQVACMVPTEVLAEQHYRTLSHYLSPLGINVGLLQRAPFFEAVEDIRKLAL